MRSWEHKTLDDLQQKLKPSVTEEFKKEYTEENPSKPALEGKLSDEHQTEVDTRVKKQAKVELQKAFQESAKKCEFLLMFETQDVSPKIEDSNINPVDNTTFWGGWNP
jgi:Asp-tRNA(Asn)/Glu-tRNA(Gln) amidotransferase A subunit family amidase